MGLSAGLPFSEGMLWAGAMTVTLVSARLVPRVARVVAIEGACVGVTTTLPFGLAMYLGPLGLDPLLALAMGVMMAVLRLPAVKRWQERRTTNRLRSASS
jgi:Kef-type K+ transport system membrane component KefB